MIYVFYKINEGENILEEDIITIYGELHELQEYTSIFGVEITIPRCYAKFIAIEE